jgi:glutaredoxin
MRECLYEHLWVRNQQVSLVMLRQLVLYGRPECHLCDEARELLTRLVAEAGDVVMVERNIEEDDDLHRRFLERIPVVELDGRIVGELVPDPQRLRSTLLNNSAR